MKLQALCILLFAAFAAADELVLAETCVEEECELPDCRCSSTNIPGGLAARDTPQIVIRSEKADSGLSGGLHESV
ncbi:hypothetical protein EVAR_60243_1 [Eumeta japonica]|uniref:Uncharacterized protein n=1 Tax=Eumeta variegata TaxID=151549 RepID=A0A4C1ZTY3_EUMVA|nr:hypothetical protein EVAR_60243_1 [Eumeta japonica]